MISFNIKKRIVQHFTVLHCIFRIFLINDSIDVMYE